MNNQRILPIVLVIVIVAAGVWIWVSKNNSAQPNDASGQQATFNPKKPNFVMGEITYVDDQVIYFSSQGKIWTAGTSADTKFTKQVKDAKGVLTNTEANRSDLKVKQIIVVYFDSEPAGQVYSADKIQIISL